MNILIVEDEGITALFIESVIEDLGHSVLGKFINAKSLYEFLNHNSSIDLVFMDIKINGSVDGIEAAKYINEKYPDISIVFITSFKDTDTIKSAKIASPLGYLIKPVIDSEIEAILMVVESSRSKQLQKIDDEVPLGQKIIVGIYIYDNKIDMLYENDKAITLSKNEKECIKYLIDNKNIQISNEQLITKIWGDDSNRSDSLRELIYRLRKKLPDITIKSTPKVGYILIA